MARFYNRYINFRHDHRRPKIGKPFCHWQTTLKGGWFSKGVNDKAVTQMHRRRCEAHEARRGRPALYPQTFRQPGPKLWQNLKNFGQNSSEKTQKNPHPNGPLRLWPEERCLGTFHQYLSQIMAFELFWTISFLEEIHLFYWNVLMKLFEWRYRKLDADRKPSCAICKGAAGTTLGRPCQCETLYT